MKPSSSDADHFRGQPIVLGSQIVSSSAVTNQDIVTAVDNANIVQR